MVVLKLHTHKIRGEKAIVICLKIKKSKFSV